MLDFSTIKVNIAGQIAEVWLSRPEIRNAFNERMISELIQAFASLSVREDVRIIILRGEGKAFCAGADLNWMRGVASYSYEQNYAESLRLSECFYSIYTNPKPTIAVVHGAAIGGANGLLAACDIAVCEENTVFSLSEVKIGIVPACISPYILKRTGEFTARELMLTGKRFSGSDAAAYRLVNKSLPEDDIQGYLDEICGQLLTSGPMAIRHCKNLINEVSNNLSLSDALSFTAAMIADIRASAEGQEGMASFLEKRKPEWVKD
jgi:methylglutaconyl-CoA hydratase